jgi:hypothetical protein
MAHPLSRRHFLYTLTAASLVAPRLARGAEEKETLDLTVDKNGWGTSPPANVHAVVLAAAREIWRCCPGQLIRPIYVYHRTDYPMTDFMHDLRGRVRIGIASEDRRWAQMAFQFGHEFCHALAQHSAAAKRSWHPPRHANLWFEESMCEAGSLFVLRRLAIVWRSAPPYPQWQSYSSSMAQYASDRLARTEHQLPEGQSFAEWFRGNESAMRENPVLRAKNVIIARQLLPLFEAEPAGWEALCYLNLGKREQGKPLRQVFAEWQTASPDRLRPFIARVGKLFDIGV